LDDSKDKVVMSATAAMEEIMMKVQPHLDKIAFIFGAKARITLLIQAGDQPGCLVLGNTDQKISQLIKSLRETESMETTHLSSLAEEADADYQNPKLRLEQ